MIRNLFTRIFTLRHRYDRALDRQRARLVMLMAWIMMAAAVIYITVQSFGPTWDRSPQFLTAGALVLAVAFLLGGVTIWFVQTGRLLAGSVLLLIVMAVPGLIAMSGWPNTLPTISGSFIVLILLPVFMAAAALSGLGVAIVTGLEVAAVLAAALLQSQDPTQVVMTQADHLRADLPLMLAVFVPFTILAVMLARMLERSTADVPTGGAQMIFDPTSLMPRSDDEDEVIFLGRASNVLRERFQAISARIYLRDPEGRLSSRVELALGQVVLRMDVEPETDSILNEAALSALPITTTIRDAPERRGHLIAAAAEAVAVPLGQGSMAPGVLDLQRSASLSLSPADLGQLRLACEQLGIALGQLRAIQAMRRGLADLERANARLQTQLAELRQREQQGVSSAWSGYLEGRGAPLIGFDITDAANPLPIMSTDLPESIVAGFSSGRVQVMKGQDDQTLSVPIRFRSQTLGAMSFTIPAGQTLDEHQIEMAETVAERLGLALENTRLFEQSQAQALRERKASEITASLLSATDLQTVLKTAASTFNEALGAVQTRIVIQPETLGAPLVQGQSQEER